MNSEELIEKLRQMVDDEEKINKSISQLRRRREQLLLDKEMLKIAILYQMDKERR